ncbi:hypothetical protein QQF64_032532 [Cirrhinus molitorella]|uniref:Uncharacterized protein n=1 Tax=Cirrhinus molitorella TaxID=172907 RepID=A0ABR3N027_9TELE
MSARYLSVLPAAPQRTDSLSQGFTTTPTHSHVSLHNSAGGTQLKTPLSVPLSLTHTHTHRPQPHYCFMGGPFMFFAGGRGDILRVADPALMLLTHRMLMTVTAVMRKNNIDVLFQEQLGC